MRPVTLSIAALAGLLVAGAFVARSRDGVEPGAMRGSVEPAEYAARIAAAREDGRTVAVPIPPSADAADPVTPHSFYFIRGRYSSYGGRWGRRQAWATDYDKSDRQFNVVLRRLTNIDAYPEPHWMTLDDPDLRRFPFLYILEVGSMQLSQPEVEGLRSYLLAGGFLVVDDFWGTRETANFESEMRRVLPEFPIEELTLDHEIFHTFYDVTEILQVPSINNWRWGQQTSENDGYVPYVKGIFDNEGRLLVVINQNTDLGDAWEWAEQPDYPLKFSTYAFQMGVNFIIYSMSH